MRTLATILTVLAALAALVAHFGSRWADAEHGRDVILLIAQHAPDEVEFNRELFDPAGMTPTERRDAVISIYGSNPAPQVDRILFPDEAKLIVPKEDPSLTLYPRGAEGAGYAYQSASLLYVADQVTYGAAAAFALLLLLRLTLLRRRPEAADAA